MSIKMIWKDDVGKEYMKTVKTKEEAGEFLATCKTLPRAMTRTEIIKNSYIHIEMDGTAYAVPVIQAAQSYCDYYESPIDEVDDDDIIDWAYNNMNYSDFKGNVVIIPRNMDNYYNDMWCDGDMSIISKEEFGELIRE